MGKMGVEPNPTKGPWVKIFSFLFYDFPHAYRLCKENFNVANGAEGTEHWEVPGIKSFEFHALKVDGNEKWGGSGRT
jgi:hypothetical protein